MACKEQDKIIAFDTLFSNNHIQMLKVLLPFMDNQTQKSLAIYIKFLELSYTIDFCKKHPFSMLDCTKQEPFSDFSGLCGELLPFCNEQEKKQIGQIRNIFQSMEMYREMSKTMEAMKEFMPDMGDLFQNMQAASFTGGNPFDTGFTEAASSGSTTSDHAASPDGSSGFNITNLLMNMMTPEQKEMFELFGGNDHAE